MDLYTLKKSYPTQRRRIRLLEEIRWEGEPACPKCGCTKVVDCTWRQGYWKCKPCRREFSVLVGTVFEGTKIPLEKWFDVIALICNSKRGLSAANVSRNFDIRIQNAWSVLMRIRIAMREWNFELEGVVEADEAYIGPKKHRKRHKNMLAQEPGVDITTLTSAEKWGVFPRGKGTIKKQVVGVVERGGKAALRTFLDQKASSADIYYMIKENVNMVESVLVTDQAKEYMLMDRFMERFSVNHGAKEYARDWVHTNSIEGLWSHLKGNMRGSHIRVDNQYLPFYVGEYAYRYNRRKMGSQEVFWDLLRRCLLCPKCFKGFKPTADPETLMYDMADQTNEVDCQGE